MIFALIITPIIIVTDCGSITDANAVVAAKSADMVDIFKGTSIIGMISLAGWGLGYVGQPHILVRFMAAKSVRGMGGARRICISWMALCLLGAMLVGFYGVAFAERHGITVDNPEQIFIIATQTLFTPWIAGILLSAILAAVMSTLSCQLLVASTTLTADFYRTALRPHASQTELVWVGRAMLLLVAIIAYIIAWDPNSGILKLVSYAWAGFGAAFGPTVVFSVFWRKMTLPAAILGMITGAVTVIVWEIGGFFDMYSLVPGFILSSLVIYVVSLATQKDNAGVEQLFNHLEAKFWEEVKEH